jgi:hypothetical protein
VSGSAPLGKRVDITLLGQKKTKKTDCLVLTRLEDAEKLQIVFQPTLRDPAICQSSVLGEMLDRVLSVVVIP